MRTHHEIGPMFGTQKVRTDPRYMWRVRAFQLGVVLFVLAIGYRLAQMAGAPVPPLF